MTTWLDIKNSVFGLMFLETADQAEYLPKIYDAANYALNEAVKVQPIYATYAIAQRQLVNLLTDTSAKHSKEDVIFTATNAKAYSFEVNGVGTCTLSADGVTVSTINLTGTGYQTYKGLITATGSISLTFSGSYMYSIRNVALYESVLSADANDVPALSKYTTYDLPTLKTDFIGFDEITPVLIEKSAQGLLEKPEYYIEYDKYLNVLSSFEGDLTIYYKKRPTVITSSTLDTFVIELNQDICNLVHLLIAYKMLLDDDAQKAVMYFNEYQNGVSQIQRKFAVNQSVSIGGGYDI